MAGVASQHVPLVGGRDGLTALWESIAWARLGTLELEGRRLLLHGVGVAARTILEPSHFEGSQVLLDFEQLLADISAAVGADEKITITQAKSLLRQRGSRGVSLAARLGKASTGRNQITHAAFSLLGRDILAFLAERAVSDACGPLDSGALDASTSAGSVVLDGGSSEVSELATHPLDSTLVPVDGDGFDHDKSTVATMMKDGIGGDDSKEQYGSEELGLDVAKLPPASPSFKDAASASLGNKSWTMCDFVKSSKNVPGAWLCKCGTANGKGAACSHCGLTSEHGLGGIADVEEIPCVGGSWRSKPRKNNTWPKR